MYSAQGYHKEVELPDLVLDILVMKTPGSSASPWHQLWPPPGLQLPQASRIKYRAAVWCDECNTWLGFPAKLSSAGEWQ